jgi:hypothetical protein
MDKASIPCEATRATPRRGRGGVALAPGKNEESAATTDDPMVMCACGHERERHTYEKAHGWTICRVCRCVRFTPRDDDTERTRMTRGVAAVAELIIARSMCVSCIAARSGLSWSEVNAALDMMATVFAVRHEVPGRCGTCGAYARAISLGAV